MPRISAATRITLGLVCSMLGILLAAQYLSILPDKDAMITSGRQQLVESLAFNSAPIIQAGELKKLEGVLQLLVERHALLARDNKIDGEQKIASAGIRRNGELVAETANHAACWPNGDSEESTEDFMQVSLSAQGEKRWARLEIAFQPLHPNGALGRYQTSKLKLLLFCPPIAFFTFRWFLTMVLKNLDPSHAVPRRVREALDILSE